MAHDTGQPGLELDEGDLVLLEGEGVEVGEIGDLDLSATPQEHAKAKRKGSVGGRPAKDRSNVPEPVQLGAKPLPVPTAPHKLYKSDATSPAKLTKQFYNYWNTLPQWAKNFCTAYVYRLHPVLLEPPEPLEGETKSYKYIDKIDGNTPLQDDMDLLNRYGCGSYKIIFNELGKSEKGNNNRVLCESHSMWLGGSDFKSNPPTDERINDISNLDITHPANKSYIAFLRGKGIIPEEINVVKEREEQEMAAIREAQAQDTSRTVDTLVQALVSKEREPRGGNDGLSLRDVQMMIADSNRALLAELRAMQPVAPAPVMPQKDPMDLALQLVTLMNGAKSENAEELRELRSQVQAQNQQQTQAMLEQMKTLMEQRNTGPAAGAVTDSISGLKQMKSALEDLGLTVGNGSAAEDVLDAAGPKWLQQYSPLIEKAIGVAGMWLASRNAPQQMQPLPQQNPGMGQVQLPAPAQPQIPPGFPPELAQLLDSVNGPLGNYITDNEVNGSQFANWFIAGYGEQTYESLVGFGAEQISQALLTYPVTARTLMQVPPLRLKTFIEEFCNPVDEDGEDNTPSTPGPVAVPPVPTAV